MELELKNSGAIVLAAGLSRRMGAPKMLLPWGEKTVIEHTVTNLIRAGVSEIVVVTGGLHGHLTELLARYSVRFEFNPHFENGEMLLSFQVGLKVLTGACCAAFMVLGDQPGIPAALIRQLWQEYLQRHSGVTIPSYQFKRGHPWLVDRMHWNDILALQPPQTLRDFLRSHEQDIHYLVVESEAVLQDLDTPEDYRKLQNIDRDE